ncbi:MAG: VWA domain-containing protein [Verrucomicrobiales bacterium]|nr:VWA domain-containing protein [Verrucomicrobiales bacterium]
MDRPVPKALQKLADYLEFDLAETEAEMNRMRTDFEALAAILETESSEAFAKIKELTPEFFSAEAPKPSYTAEVTWMWPQYRKPGAEKWITADATFENNRSAHWVSTIEVPTSETRIRINGVRGDGSRVNLMSWRGDAVGRDVEVLFLPADRKPAELMNIREPNVIWTWAPVVQVGSETIRGKPFTPEGAVLSNYDGAPASFFNEKGDLDFLAPEVQKLSVVDVVCGDGKRVRVRLNATTQEAPRWHTGNFSLKDDGMPVKRLRMESGGSLPRPVILVVDASGSMSDGGRDHMARKAINNVIGKLPDHQKLGLIVHSFEKATTLQELKPKGEGQAAEAFGKVIFGNIEAVLPAVNAALEMATEPSTILFLSDGRDMAASKPGYANKLAATLEALRESDSTLIPVGIGEADPVLMTKFAEASGTEYVIADDPASLPDLYNELGTGLSGAIELSYVIPEAAVPGTTRALTVEMDGFEGPVEASYEVKEGTPFGLVRLEMEIDGNPNIDKTRTLIDFSDGYDGWRMMTKASVWMSPSIYPKHIVESRRVDEWIEALLMAEFMNGGELDETLINRSFSFQQGATLNRIRSWHTAVSPGTPLPLGPSLWMKKESLRLQGADVVKRSDLDWVSGSNWPVVENREQLASSFLALLSAEGIVWANESVNATLMDHSGSLKKFAATDSLPENVPPSLEQLQGEQQDRILIVNPAVPTVGWKMDQSTGGIYGYIAHGHEVAKGASLETTAAEFREIRSMLQIYSTFGGGALSGAMLPSGAVFSALCSYFDQVVRMYCYSTLMMQQVNVAIDGGGGNFDPRKAKATAEKLCETSGDADDFARNLMRESVYGFVRGTAENVVGGEIDSRYSKRLDVKPGSAADVAVSAGSSVAVSTADPTPGSYKEVSNHLGIGGSPSAVSSPSFGQTVDKAIFSN